MQEEEARQRKAKGGSSLEDGFGDMKVSDAEAEYKKALA